MKTTSQIFHDLNAKLLSGLIDNEPPEARGCIDPFDPVFEMKITAPVSALKLEI